MSVFLTILAVLGVVLAAIIALVILLIIITQFIKAGVIVGYNDEESLFLRIRYFAITLDILPMKKKTKTKKTEQKPSEPDSTEKKLADTDEKEPSSQPEEIESSSKPEKVKKESLFRRKLKLMLPNDWISIVKMLGKHLTKLRFGDIYINIATATENAADTAVLYGALTAAVFPVLGAINNRKHAKSIDAHITADFSADKTVTDVYTEIYLRTFRIVALVLRALAYILKKKESNINGK